MHRAVKDASSRKYARQSLAETFDFKFVLHINKYFKNYFSVHANQLFSVYDEGVQEAYRNH